MVSASLFAAAPLKNVGEKHSTFWAGKRTSEGDEETMQHLGEISTDQFSRGKKQRNLSGSSREGIHDTPKTRAIGDAFLAGGMHAAHSA